MRRRTFLGGALGSLVLAGCSGVPGDGDPIVVSSIAPSSDEVSVQPPQDGLEPYEIVTGFIDKIKSSVPLTGTTATFTDARQYLTPEQQKLWDTAQLDMVVLDGSPRVDQQGDKNDGIVTITGTLLGTVDVNRVYTPAGDDASYKAVVELVRVAGQWRIQKPPADVIIKAANFTGNYVQQPVYFLDRLQTIVVPDLRWIPTAGPVQQRANRVMTALLAGPSDSIAGAVLNQLAGVKLRKSLTIENDSLVIDLAMQEIVDAATRQAIAAQLVFTCAAVPGLPPISILVNGEPLEPTRNVWRTADVTAFDPDPASSDLQAYFVQSGVVSTIPQDIPITGAAGGGSLNVQSAAISRVSGYLAMVVGTGGQEQLMVGTTMFGAEPVLALEAEQLTTPTFSHAGDEIWVAMQDKGRRTIRRISASAPDPTSGQVAVGAPELGKGTIQAMVLSPDGVRVALIVGDDDAHRQLWLGVVRQSPQNDDADPADSTVSIENLQVLRPALGPVRAVAFRSSRELVALVPGAPYASFVRVPIDGSQQVPMPTTGLEQDATGIAIRGDTAYATILGGRVLQLSGDVESGYWQLVETNGLQLTGGAPFFPS